MDGIERTQDTLWRQSGGFIEELSVEIDLIHRRTSWIVGVDQIIAEAVGMKFLAAPLTPEQVKELIQIPH